MKFAIVIFALCAVAVFAQDGPSGTPDVVPEEGAGPVPAGYGPPPTSNGGYGRGGDPYYTPYNFAGHYAASYKPRPNDSLPKTLQNPKAKRQPPPSIVMYQSYVPYGDESTGYGAPSSGYAPPTGVRASGYGGSAAPLPAPEATSPEAPIVAPPAESAGEAPPAGYEPSVVPEDPEPAPVGYGPPRQNNLQRRRGGDAYYTPYNFAGHYAASYKPRPNDSLPKTQVNPKANRQPPPSIVMYQSYVPYGDDAGPATYAPQTGGYAPTYAPQTGGYAPVEEVYDAPAQYVSNYQGAPAYQAAPSYAPSGPYLIPHYKPVEKVHSKYQPYLYAKPPKYEETQKVHSKYQPYLYAKPHPKYSEYGDGSAAPAAGGEGAPTAPPAQA